MVKRMKFVHRISAFRYASQGEMLPRGYGIAWVEFCTDRAVCLPVPLHIIASFIRTAWQKVRIWRAPDLLRAEYDRGRQMGYQRGYDVGRGEAKRAEQRSVMAVMAILGREHPEAAETLRRKAMSRWA